MFGAALACGADELLAQELLDEPPIGLLNTMNAENSAGWGKFFPSQPSAAPDRALEAFGRARAQLEAIREVSQADVLLSGDVERAARLVTETAARVSGCDRVNAWLFDESETELRCIDLFELSLGRHSSGMVLHESEFRDEFRVLKDSAYVAADDPLTDPRTAGYVPGYLEPLGITSMLDVVIRASGRNFGLLCLEHVGRSHHWEQDEIAFACQLADKIALTLVSRARLRAETDLQHALSGMHEAQAVAHVGSWVWDIQRAVLTWSDETCRIFEVPPDIPPSWQGFFEAVHPEDRSVVEQAYEASLRDARGAVDHRIVFPDGRTKYVQERWRTRTDESGRPAWCVGTVLDITERQQAQRQLQISEEKYRRLVESTTDYIWEVDATARFSYVSPRMTALLDVRVGDSVRQMLRTWGREAGRALAAARGTRRGDPRPFSLLDIVVRSRDGYRLVMESSGTPVFDSTGAFSGYRGISRDVTARHEAIVALNYRDAVLHAVEVSASELVKGPSLVDALPRALEMLGRVLEVDRVHVFHYLQDSDTPRLLHAWSDPGVCRPDVRLAGLDAVLLRSWLRSTTLLVSQQDARPSPPGDLTRAFQTTSLWLAPIVVADDVWGFISVDALNKERDWASTEIESIGTLAEVIGALAAREAAVAALRNSEQTFRTVTEVAQDAIIMIDADARVCFWNPAAERILGHTAAEAQGRHIRDWLTDQGPDPMSPHHPAGVTQLSRGAVEVTAMRKDGCTISLELSFAPMTLGGRSFSVGILRDITERKATEAEMLRMARFDALTGLSNRASFAYEVQQCLARARRGSYRFAVLYIDLDHFKDINDTLGHPTGDRLLQLVAERLRSCLREADTVARLGGDEFAILQTDLKDVSGTAVLARRALDLLQQPFTVDGNVIRTGASLGIALGGENTDGGASLLAHADIALYRAKAQGRGTFCFFTEAMDADVRTRVRLSEELREAIDDEQLLLEYQPQVDLVTGRVVGLEALVRWQHPIRGILQPGEFIRLAETTGLIVPLGEWVIHRACRDAAGWLEAGLSLEVIAVNVSPLQFKAPHDLERSILAALATSGLPAEALELELTETALMEASRDHADMLGRLRHRRIRISIDDFGTGYSSLDYLRQFPVDRIKIAQAFVSGLGALPSNAAIVRATLGLARELGLAVIAEGVETRHENDLLRAWGCRQAQGMYFSGPIGPVEVGRLLRRGSMDPLRLAGSIV